jgi:hypothetical protein
LNITINRVVKPMGHFRERSFSSVTEFSSRPKFEFRY